LRDRKSWMNREAEAGAAVRAADCAPVREPSAPMTR
jgi:hypothetical protein